MIITSIFKPDYLLKTTSGKNVVQICCKVMPVIQIFFKAKNTRQ